MNTLALLLVGLVALARFTQGQEVIRPVVAPEFGKQITVKAEFVPKSNTYHSQNLVREPYALKVVAVNGRTLKEPVLIEYTLQADGKDRARIEQLGTPMLLEAYETLYQPPGATPWLGEFEQGSGFGLVHLLYVRPPQKKGQPAHE
jgi:hypothetical protein